MELKKHAAILKTS